jgi:hypothetical protein
METDDRFCVVAFGRNQASVVFNIFFYIVKNSQVLFHNGSLLHSKFNTQPLITVHNSSRILTHV